MKRYLFELDLFELVASIFMIIVIVSFALIVVSLILDSLSFNECRILGYDNGDQVFWQGKTICWNVINDAKEEEREYFSLDK